MSTNINLTLASGFYYFNAIKNRDVATTVFDGNAGNANYEKMTTISNDTLFSYHYVSDCYLSDNFILLNFSGLPRPLTLKGQYLKNFGVKAASNGYVAGLSYGELTDKGQWRFYYQYQQIQQDAVFSPFVQDDFLRQTNFKSHVFGIAYAFHRRISLHTWGLVDHAELGSGEKNTRLRLDLNVKI